MKVNEVFEGIQGEGRYVGHPVLFVRVSNCNLNCSFCDTEFITGRIYSVEDLTKEINRSKMDTVVWTGGEPTLQLDEIVEVVDRTPMEHHHLESNGYRLDSKLNAFSYLCFSPKNLKDARRIKEFGEGDIKIVTDLELNKELIPYATMLMPLSTFTQRDLEIERNVWNYCIKDNIRYSPRIHVNLWGNDRGK